MVLLTYLLLSFFSKIFYLKWKLMLNLIHYEILLKEIPFY